MFKTHTRVETTPHYDDEQLALTNSPFDMRATVVAATSSVIQDESASPRRRNGSCTADAVARLSVAN